jgi:DNA-binding transcriptional LysR family regulator
MTDAPPSLKWLTTFRTFAHCGSVQTTAHQSGLSVSTVSHQLQCLEKHLGIALVDHASRPMVLTAHGAVYLRYAKEILDLSAQASREIKDITPHHLARLRFAMIEDFESDIGPEISQQLASVLPNRHFSHYTRASHDILNMFRNRELDIGIAMRPQAPLPNIQEYPLLRDPFVIAIPASASITSEQCIAGESGLPFLRYMPSQIMGAMIEAQLSRMRIDLATTFELDSTSSMMSLVARGNGWAITTPSNYARVWQFQRQIRLLPLPRKAFARTISMFVAEPLLEDLAMIVATAFRSQMSGQTMDQIIDSYPWLLDNYRLITDDA